MKAKILLLLTSLFFSFSINAQIDFEPHITIDDTGGTNNPKSVFAADLDGDGDMDMLSASNNDSKIAWYENTDGQGNFGTQQIISETVYSPYSVFASDLDGDGDMDVLSASITGDTIGWFENLDGQGTFGEYQTISILVDGAISVYAADADGDGDMDVFSTSIGDNKITWYENLDGQATFGTQQIISTNINAPFYMSLGDIDGDGDVDLISGDGNFESNIVWFKNQNGQGDFAQQQVLTEGLNTCRSAVLADIDGDGDLDIVVASQRLVGGAVLLWFENTNGLGAFNNTPIIIDTVNNIEVVMAEDFDNDGNMDIAVGCSNAGIYWYKNNGTGNFGAQQIVDPVIKSVNTLFATDIDNDGDSDLLMAAGTDDRVAWHKNTNGQGNFGPANEVADINGANGTYHLHPADLDGDGDKDIIAALTNDNRVVWQENLDGQGNFSQLKEIGNLSSAIAVFSGDMGGDGKMDVLAAGYEKLIWYRNLDGLGSFGNEQTIDYQQYSDMETIHAADIDGDGDLDVFGHLSSNILFWKENNGSGGFGPRQIISQQYVLSDSIVTADMDNDGDLDLVVCYWGVGVIAWFENTDGQGNFGTTHIIDTLLAPGSVDVGDFDGDGDMDVLTLDYGNDEVMWYENIDGQGTFGSVKIISSTVENPFSIKATDIDNDGDMDVLATSYSTASLWLFQNDGNGNFNNGQPFTSEVRSPIFVTADDFNGDGKMDVLAPSYSNDEIIWFENRGPLGIEENTTNLFSIYPNPTDGLLNIQSVSPISEITIYNKIGQLLFTSEEKESVDISFLSQGIYFIKVVAENGQAETKKVIKK